MKYVLTVQRTYETQVVLDVPDGTVMDMPFYKYPTRHLNLRSEDYELVEESIDDIRGYEELDDEHLPVADYVKG